MKDTVFFATAMIAERLVSFLLLPILTKMVTPEEYAVWSQSIVISGVMIPVVLMGFQIALVKFFPLWDGQEKLQGSILLFMLGTIFAVLTVIVVAANLFDRSVATLIFGQSNYSIYIPILTGLLFSEALFEFLVGILRVTNRIRRVSLYLLMKGGWRIGVLVLVLFEVEGEFYEAFWIFVIFQLVVTFLIYVKEINVRELFGFGVSVGRNYWNKVFRFSLPLIPLAVLTATNNFVDRLFLVHFHGLDELAIYSAAFSVAAIAAFFYSILGFTLFPVLSGYWAREDMKGVDSLMKKVLIVYLSFLFPFIVFMSVIGSDVLLLLTNEYYAVPAYLLFLLTSKFGLYGLYQISHYLFLLGRGSSLSPIFMSIAVGVNILVNAMLVPEFGMSGAIIAGFISNACLAGILIYMSQQVIKWEFPWSASMRIAGRAILMGVVIWVADYRLGSYGPIELFMILTIAAIVYGILDYFDKNTSVFSVIRST